MIKIDQGFLISKIKYNENSIIADFYTEESGRLSGIIFGGTSKKIRGYLQLGNFFHLNLNTKNNSKTYSIKTEIIRAYTPLYFNNQKKLLCITSAMSLIKNLTPENEKNESIFRLIQNFFHILDNNNWLKNYINWELNLLKYLGYDLNLKEIVCDEIINNETIYYVKSSTQKKIVPNFLINDEIVDVGDADILKGINLVSNYMEKKIFSPNNMKIPIQRLQFENLLHK
tara:strand:+ start:2903 stop:3586 length:684 start_codon:yes stop_codon:yes gene_type:complete